MSPAGETLLRLEMRNLLSQIKKSKNLPFSLTSVEKNDTVPPFKGFEERKVPLCSDCREEAVGVSFHRREGKALSEPRCGNTAPDPSVMGNEVRVSQTRIQVEPRIKFDSP